MARAELSTQSRKVSSLSSTYEYKSKKTPSLKEKNNFCDQNLHKFFKQFFFYTIYRFLHNLHDLPTQKLWFLYEFPFTVHINNIFDICYIQNPLELDW